MCAFATLDISDAVQVRAPDGSDVRILLALANGSMAHFALPANHVSRGVVHRTVEEIWFIVSGSGEMWRKQDDRESVVQLSPGMSLTIPVGTQFQFRASTFESVTAVAITMPPWPGSTEASFLTLLGLKARGFLVQSVDLLVDATTNE